MPFKLNPFTGNLDVVSASIATPVSLANGGWGQGMTMQTYSTTGSVTTLPSGLIKYTGSGAMILRGIVAPTTSVFTYVQNVGSGISQIQITNQDATATAINRIITSSGSTIIIYPGFSASFFYDTVTARWRLISVNYINSVSGPLAVSTAGNLTIPQASSGASGYLSSTDWYYFNTKVSDGGGAANYRVPIWSGTQTQIGLTDFSFNPTTKRLGVGTSDWTVNEATGHFKSDTPITLAGLTSPTATLTQFTLLGAPSYSTPTQSPGHLYAPTSLSATPQTGTNSAYIAADVIDYRITAYDSTGAQTFSVVNSTTQATIVNGTGASDGDDVQINWTANGAGTATISGYIVERQINAGGYNAHIDVGNVTSYLDNSSGWSGTFSPSPIFHDFVANGSVRNYTAYSKGADPRSQVIYSSTGTTPMGFVDDNSGNPYVINHAATTGSGGTTNRILNTDLTTYADGDTFTEDTTTFSAGSTVTPNTFGTQSNGTFWYRSYEFYNYDSTLGIYSAGSGAITTTDPNDSNYYYVSLTFGGVATTSKIILDATNSNATYFTSPIIDDGYAGNWTGNTTVTPNSTYAPVGLFESHGSTLTNKATIISRSLDGAYSRLEFQDNNKNVLSYIENVPGALKLSSSVSQYISLSYATGLMDMAANALNGVFSTIALDATSVGHLKANGSERLGWSSGGIAMYAPTGGIIGLVYNSNYYVQVDSAGVTLNSVVNIGNATNVVLGTATGTKFGTSTSQKLSFYNSTPIVQPGATTDLGTVLSNLGLRASGTAYPITTSGTKNFTDLTASKLVLTDGSSNLVSSTTALLIAAGVPVIVKTGRATAQTAANTSVATYTTPASDGSYEISANVLVTTSTVHSFTVTVDYTDEGNTARTVTLNFQNVDGTILTAIANAGGAVPYDGVPLHIRTKASTAITFKTAGTFTTVTYNVEGIIKQSA